MHSPQPTQVDEAIGTSASNEMLVPEPLPARPMTKFFFTSVQPRMQRSHRMQAVWSTLMNSEDSSCPWGEGRDEKRGAATPQAVPKRSSSQSCVDCWRSHGEGWSLSSSSASVRRARCTPSVAVATTIPSSAGRTQAAASTRAFLTSTVHTRHTPTGVWCWAWHRVGMSMPTPRAASKMVVPAGTVVSRPSIVSFTVLPGLITPPSDRRWPGNGGAAGARRSRHGNAAAPT